MASAIVSHRRRNGPITTTKQLVGIILRQLSSSNPVDSRRVFQAIRILVNDEIKELKFGLKQVHSRLNKGALLCVTSFHSGECRAVKEFFSEHSKFYSKVETRKPEKDEVAENSRSGSARLRYAFKLE